MTSKTRICSKLLQKAHPVVKRRRKLHHVFLLGACSPHLPLSVMLKAKDTWPCMWFSKMNFQTKKPFQELNRGSHVAFEARGYFYFPEWWVCYWMFSWLEIREHSSRGEQRCCFVTAEVSNSKGEGSEAIRPELAVTFFELHNQQARGWNTHTG